MKPENILAQKRRSAEILTFCGGFIDCYTYMLRGHTLSAGQTGNVIFFSSSLVNGNWQGVLNRGLTIIAFILGLFLVNLIHLKTNNRYWRIIEMIPLMCLTFLVGFLPLDVPNFLIVPLLGLGMSMQSGAFLKIEGKGYSNVFTSGNIRKAILSFSQLYLFDDSEKEREAKDYLFVVLAFTFGAILSAVIQKGLGIRTIWIASFILIVFNINYGINIYRSYKK